MYLGSGENMAMEGDGIVLELRSSGMGPAVGGCDGAMQEHLRACAPWPVRFFSVVPGASIHCYWQSGVSAYCILVLDTGVDCDGVLSAPTGTPKCEMGFLCLALFEKCFGRTDPLSTVYIIFYPHTVLCEDFRAYGYLFPQNQGPKTGKETLNQVARQE